MWRSTHTYMCVLYIYTRAWAHIYAHTRTQNKISYYMNIFFLFWISPEKINVDTVFLHLLAQNSFLPFLPFTCTAVLVIVIECNIASRLPLQFRAIRHFRFSVARNRGIQIIARHSSRIVCPSLLFYASKKFGISAAPSERVRWMHEIRRKIR